ncbi:Thymidylate kinase [Orchesella cincta]|uniref:Thymidylate kinase n=1 Tax=Orchesella cincta TaxID=48709 RepID=A0A1D2NBB1_ORCCI|nr:Thymidylate kinase [Orchesella cincta]
MSLYVRKLSSYFVIKLGQLSAVHPKPKALSTSTRAEKSSKMNGNGNGSLGGRGALIVLEGCDKAGKSTQCRLLVEALKKAGKPCHLYAFPDRTTEIGKVIDEYLRCTKNLSDEAIHLLFSTNRWEVMPKIRELLLNGESVVLDRYAFSGVAFSAAKGTLDLAWCMGPDVGLPQPDLVCFLNLSKEAASKRGDFGRERYEKTEFQDKVKSIFLKIQDPAYWKIIDADRTKEEVQSELFQLSIAAVDTSENKPILKLWDSKSKKKEAEAHA